LLALVFVGLLSYFFIAGRAKLPATSAEVKSMAVLPFRTLGTKSDDDYLGLGLADALITRLGRMRELTIRPIGAVQKFAAARKIRSNSDASWVSKRFWKELCSMTARSYGSQRGSFE
jgi:hypothetical protein